MQGKSIFWRLRKAKAGKSACRIDTFDQIPYASEQGKLLNEQGKYCGNADKLN